MVSRSNFDFNLAFGLGAILAFLSTAHAQLASTPKRYRSAASSGDTTPPYIPEGRRQKKRRQRVGGARTLEQLSMPLVAHSMPLIESGIELSVPLVESEMSLPLLEAEMSMPAIDTLPEAAGGAVPLSNDNNGSGAKIILASFLAGISAVVVGASVFLVRKRNQKQEDDSARCLAVCNSKERGEGQMRCVEDIDIEHDDLEDISII